MYALERLAPAAEPKGRPQYGLDLPLQLSERIDAIAATMGLSREEVIRRAVRVVLPHEAPAHCTGVHKDCPFYAQCAARA